PLRADVKAAVAECRRAGIEVKMITGDNVRTARAIAYEIGLVERRDAPIDTPDAQVLTSPRFNELHARLKDLRARAELAPAAEASKIVLLDDAFSTIVKAVHWGRSLYENIQRFIQFQLTINVSALTLAFLGPFFGVRPPSTVLQLLWINVIMDTFASIALCSEPPREGVMRLPPKRRAETI